MHRTREPGFTLLEILVMLVVLGILLATLTQGMRFSVRASEHQARMLRSVSDLDATDRTFRQLIERMHPGSLSGKPPYFVGQARLLSFTSDLPEAFALRSRDADVTLAVDAAHQLRLIWAPHQTTQDGQARSGPAITAAVLLNGVDHIELGYRGFGTTNPGWQSRWQALGLPGLIRLRIVFTPGDGRQFPDIVVSPKRDRAQP